MISQEIIRDLKKKYNPIFKTEFEEYVFIWRQLTRKEYDDAIYVYEDEGEREEYVCSLCVLYPEGIDYSTLPAGYATRLCQNIVSESYFATDGRAIAKLKELRIEMEDFDKQAPVIIASAFPQYDFEEIKNWNMSVILERLAQAEWALIQIHGYPGEFSFGENNGENNDVEDFPELHDEAQFLKGKTPNQGRR